MKSNLIATFILAGFAVSFSEASHATDEDFARLLAKYQKEDPVNWQAKFQTDYERALRPNSQSPAVVQNAQAKMAKRAPTDSKPNDAKNDTDSSLKPSVTFLVRDSFSDIWLFDNPTAVSSAKGASVSWSQDNIAHDAAWSIHGMAAAAVAIPGDFATPGRIGVLGTSLAAYVQVDRDIHSKLVKKNSDTIAGGGTGEIGIDAFGGSQYFR